MAEPVLVPHVDAGAHHAEVVEPEVPAGWPGTYVPNFSDWRDGDIVLVHRTDDVAGHALAAGQRTARRAAVRRMADWTHAGMYVGHGEIVEANVGTGVVCRSVWVHCQYRALRVRRLKSPFSAAHGQAAAAAARRHVGQPYSWPEVLRAKIIPGTEPEAGALYCSTFVGFVLNAATGFSIYAEAAYRPLYPATIATHSDLKDVDVGWRLVS